MAVAALHLRFGKLPAASFMAAEISPKASVPKPAPLPGRAKQTAAKTESRLTPEKNETKSVPVTFPPDAFYSNPWAQSSPEPALACPEKCHGEAYHPHRLLSSDSCHERPLRLPLRVHAHSAYAAQAAPPGADRARFCCAVWMHFPLPRLTGCTNFSLPFLPRPPSPPPNPLGYSRPGSPIPHSGPRSRYRAFETPFEPTP